MKTYEKFWKHLKTITRHKWLVGKLCFKCGLYKQGILHDLSKYSWVEFSAGVKYFQGNRSPIDKEKEVLGYSNGWLHHKGRNRHHWEYWVDCGRDGIYGSKVPVRYLAEMFCDRTAADMIYHPERKDTRGPLDYFMTHQHNYVMHQESKQLLREILEMYAEKGLDETVLFVKELVKGNRYAK